MSINQRIAEIINNSFRGNKRAFATAIGVNPSVIENIVGKRKSSPSFDVTSKIISSIENINIDWLMTGGGKMYKNSKDIENVEISKNTDQIFLNDKSVSQEQISKTFSWVIFNNYKSKYDTNIKFDTFEEMSKQFGATASLCDNIQKVMEMEIALNMYQLMTNSIIESKEHSIIPEELKDIIDKYDQIYNDFLNESGAMIRIMELTQKHQKTLSNIMSKIEDAQGKKM